ncbi:MAG: HlyD family secretion protein [candidate division KSB1 bacterium]|nr:HlyD family secretion protein [candidate division KSB1 bacterium]MDZ7364772.1 HlyD family secretion protein [candidate division KSB1 bacterium]MDZ7402480.1 HlyD family secretion protein [candidate division KSB1 bacterium]
MNKNGQIMEEAPALQLPELEPVRNAGTRLVNRAVSVSLLLLASLFTVGIIVALMVEIDITIKGNGTLEPTTIWPIHSQESGLIQEVFVKTGDTVSVGQTLVRLDSLSLENALNQLRAELELKRIEYQRTKSLAKLEARRQSDLLAQARARLIKAKAAYRKSLAENGFNANSDSMLSSYVIGKHVGIDVAHADVLAAEADVHYNDAQAELLSVHRMNIEKQRVELEQLEKQIHTMSERLRRLCINSPAAGIVLTEQLERLHGAYVREGELLLELADPEQWQVTLYVTERDIYRIHAGDVVKVEVKALQSLDADLLYGRVASVGVEPMAPNQKTNPAFAGLYRVTALLDHQPLDILGREKLKRGYSVRGMIITQSGKMITLLWNYFKEKTPSMF